MRKAYIVGVGQTPRKHFPQKGLGTLAAEATYKALDDAKMDIKDIQHVYFGTYHPAAHMQFTPGQMIVDAIGLSTKVGVTDIEHACATSGHTLHEGRLAIASGVYDAVLVLSASKTFDSLQSRNTNESISYGSFSVERGIMLGHADFEGYAKEYGVGDEEIYGWYKTEYWHATRNPISVCYGEHERVLSFEDYCKLPYNVWYAAPQKFGAGSTVVDGGSAIILASKEVAKRHTDKLISIEALVCRDESSYYPHSLKHTRFEMMTAGVLRNAFQAAFDQAKIKPKDLDLYQPHDNTPYINFSHVDVFFQLYDPKLPPGYGPKWYALGYAMPGGPLPLSSAATAKCGYMMPVHFLDDNIENVKQLREEVQEPERQIKMKNYLTMATVSPERPVVCILRREK
jgi:acetyl-CoA C-acetyltransferase